MNKLTDREQQVLNLLELAFRDREIAQALGISVNTVKAHVHSILTKLDADNRNRAVALWTDHKKQMMVNE